MDFQKLKDKALKFKETATEKAKQAVSYSAEKLAESNMTLRDIPSLAAFIWLSKNTFWKNPESGEEKVFVKRSIAVFLDTSSVFQKKMLLLLPVLFAKSFSQNIAFKMVDSKIAGLDLASYKVTQIPSLVIFENEQVKKVVSGEDAIEKVVKSLSLDINTSIDTL